MKKYISLIFALIACSFVFAQTDKPDALRSYNSGNYEEAIKICEAEIASNPESVDSYCVLCWALIANRQYSEAEVRATEGRKSFPYDARLMEVLGEAKYFLGKNNEALNMFQRYVSNVSDNANRLGRVYYYMGEIYIKQSKYEHADISITSAVRSEPLRDYWWARLGYAREMAGDYTHAIAAYDESLKLNPQQTEAIQGRNRCQSRTQ